MKHLSYEDTGRRYSHHYLLHLNIYFYLPVEFLKHFKFLRKKKCSVFVNPGVPRSQFNPVVWPAIANKNEILFDKLPLLFALCLLKGWLPTMSISPDLNDLNF